MNHFSEKVSFIWGILKRASGFAFYNTSRYTFERLVGDSANIAANLRAYINGFSANMYQILEKFEFERIERLKSETAFQNLAASKVPGPRDEKV